MSSDETPNQPSREDLEERVIALLMGELDGAAAEKIEAAIEKDPRLKEFHRRMQQTFGFVQEAVVGPEISKAPTPLKLSDDRRDELFAKLSGAKKATPLPDNVVEMRRASRRKWITGLGIAASLIVLFALVATMEQATKPAVAGLKADLDSGETTMARRESRSMESHLSSGEALDAMYKGLSTAQKEKVRILLTDKEAAEDEAAPVSSLVAATPATPMAASKVPASVVNFVDVDAAPDPIGLDTSFDAGTSSSSPQRMRNTRGGEKSAPAPVALSIVLPEKTEERDARTSRGQFFGRDQVTRWEDRSGLASRDGEELASRMEGEKKLAADVAALSLEELNKLDVSSVAKRVDVSSVSELSDEIRKAPRFAGTSGNQPGSAGGFGAVPMFGVVTGGAQPLGESPEGIIPNPEPKPKTPPSSFGFAGSRLSGFDEAKGKDAFNQPMSAPVANDYIQPPSEVVRESAREDALLVDTESRFDREKSALGAVGRSVRVPVSTSVASAAPVPTTTFETEVVAGVGGGMGGGGVIQDQRMYKLNNATINGVSRRAPQSVARQQGLPQQPPPAGGQGQMAAGLADGFGSNLSSRRSSSSRARFFIDKNRNAAFDAEMPELELRERQLTRELAQKQKAIDGVLSKKMAQVESESESLGEHLVDLQTLMDVEQQGNPVAAPAPLAPAENKQRLLVEQKRLGGAVAGRRSSVRGVQSRANPSDDYGMMPAPRNELRGELSAKEEAAAPSAAPAPSGFQSGAERFRQQNAEAGGTAHYLWAGQAQKSESKFNRVPTTGIQFSMPQPTSAAPAEEENERVASLIRDGKAYYELRQFDEAEEKLKEVVKMDPQNNVAKDRLRLIGEAKRDSEGRRRDHAFHERVVEVSEAWNREIAKALPQPGYPSGPVPSRPTGRGWVQRSGNAGKDADGDGLARGKQVEATVDDLFVEVPARSVRLGNKVVSGEEADAKMDFDDGAVALGGSFGNGRPNNTSWMVQTQDESRRYFRQLGDAKAPAQKELAWRKQDSKPSDKPASGKELLRRLNLDIAGQAPSPTAAEEFLKQSGGEVTRLSQDNKKGLANTARKKRVSALRSDLGRTEGKGIVVGVNDSGVDSSQQNLKGAVIVHRTNGFAGVTTVAGILPTRAVTNRFTNLISPPKLVTPGTFILSKRSNKYYITNSALPFRVPPSEPKLAAILPPSIPDTLPEAEAPKPQPKVRPKKPKTLKPKPEVLTKENAFSTFSLNVSDVAFKLASASLKAGKLPDPETVRSEEFLNALDYHDPAPRGNEKLAFAWDRARNPFAHNRDFLRFSIQTAAQGRESGQPLNLVVLLDASGSMERSDRLAIVRQMLSVLAGQLKPADRISVVAFARTPWLLVDGMKGGKPKELLDRVINITPQGGTNIEVGLDLAYLIAHRHYLANGNNRVIVLTDGAANLGNVDPEALKAKVEEQRKKNVALDCFGVGWEGYNDDLLETLSRNGDGRYGFVNDPAEARDGFADLLAGALQVSAANVKAQIEFNQKRVIAYRQIGYTKHQLKKEQFRDNTVDAAEIGAAESGTAMYSIQVDRNGTGPLATVRVRYKIPATGRYVEEEWELPYDATSKPLAAAKPSMRLASVAASFAEWMAANPHAASVSLRDLERYLTGVPEEFSSDERPKQLRTMLQQARRISGE